MTHVIGTETEYGVYRPGDAWANPIALSSQAVRLYAEISRDGTPAQGAAPVRWDYRAEDPLNDMRGIRLSRAAADPSLLTDDPYHLAPSGGSEQIERPTPEEMALPAQTTAVLTNGARLYVDHAHPEYSAPEALGALEATLYDRAGEVIARRIIEESLKSEDGPIVLVKNNTDGKGAAYGTHENYQIPRSVDFDDVVRGLTPFFVSRPVMCGAGRVGLGQKSQVPGFQISQRADFVENEVGLETTFNRPIINTRDEPHANPAHYRRLHVIGGDGNMFDVSILLKLGATSMVLWAIEQGIGLEWEALALDDAVQETWNLSHHPNLDYKMNTAGGRAYTGPELLQVYVDLVLATFDRMGISPEGEDQAILTLWQDVLDRMRADMFSVSTEVEWIGKYQLLGRQKDRLGVEWNDPRLTAMDLQWADLRPEHSLALKLGKAGRIKRLFSDQQVEDAASQAPTTTRAFARGQAVASRPDLVKASWTSLVIDPGQGNLVRYPIPDTAQTRSPVE